MRKKRIKQTTQSQIRIRMNNQFSHPLFDQARSVRLSAGAKARGRSELERLMKARPLAHSTPSIGLAVSPWTFLFRPAVSFSLLAGLILSSSASVAWAAERALPGDGLYRVKTGVTEPLRTIFITDPAARAAWETERVKRRLDELDALERENRLHDTERLILETKLQEHVEAVETLSEEENETEAIQEREQLRKNLQGHHSIEWSEEGKQIRVKIRGERKDSTGETRPEEQRSTETAQREGKRDEQESASDDEVRGRSSTSDLSVGAQTDEEDHPQSKTSSSVKTPAAQKNTNATTETSSGSQTSGSSDASRVDEEDAKRDEGEGGGEPEPETISESTARTKALAAVAGTVEEAKLTTKDGKPVWEVKINRTADGETVKAIVNAVSGNIIKIDD